MSNWKETNSHLEINHDVEKIEDNCSECGKNSVFFDENRGLVVCEHCGLVHAEKHIDNGPEWRAFDADQKKKRTRTGAPMTYMIHDKGL